MCEPLGLWCAAYSSGRIALRTLLALELSIDAQWQAPAGQDPLPVVAFMQVAACLSSCHAHAQRGPVQGLLPAVAAAVWRSRLPGHVHVASCRSSEQAC